MTRDESVRRTEQEIRQARAEALGRTGERLDAALAALSGLDRQLDRWLAEAGPAVRRDERLVKQTEARNRVRDEAVRLHHQLVIQREAIGLVRHGVVEEQYPIPPRRQL